MDNEWGDTSVGGGDIGSMTPQQVTDYLYGKQFDPVQYQTSPIDYGGGIVVNPDNTVSYTAPDASSFANTIKSIFDPNTLGGFAGLAGLAALAGQSKLFNAPPTRVGYQGTIPQMTATRTMVPQTTSSSDEAQLRSAINASLGQGFNLGQIKQGAAQKYGLDPAYVESIAANQTIPEYRRPGAGGITYFNPVQYIPKAAAGGTMSGGISELAKGRFLRGGGDGVSDSIPARFAGSGQEARLADNEFVIPARIVSEIGNGSSEAGARRLYAMIDRVQNARKKSIGKNKVAVDSKAYKALDAL